MTEEQLRVILQQLRDGLSNILGSQMVAAYLYGSQARGDAYPDSDIDILVVLQGNFNYFEMIEKTGELAAKLSLDHDTVISLAFAPKDSFDDRRIPFLLNVRQEGIAI